MGTIKKRFRDDAADMIPQAIAAVVLGFVSLKLLVTAFVGLDAWFHPEGISSFLLILPARCS